MGSFEEWSAVLGGILEVAEIHAFLGNAEIAHSQADPETAEWRALMDLWWERFGSAPVRTSDLHGLCLRSELLAEVLGFGGLRSQVSRLGRALNRHVDRVFGAFQLQQDAEAVRSSARYMLTPVRHEAVAARGREAVDSA